MTGNFKKTFNLQGVDIEFTFKTMNTAKPKLFQVYVLYQDKLRRFHLQLEDGVFKITDTEHCPEPFLALEEDFSLAILAEFPAEQ
jgi:hypothetical protein